ncbi:branched-chain-amino-acid aminotransferase 2, chloroplastic-like [Salvia splendens]|uniref:branched-chain-amino-acid aminotransferase 2, chloroplastic-like n=1 Tax=Salvia splendens TaxID=180675 RepID=UPI001C26110D|nr:branched-chain-amino-acid aminotransferase 2, chloroplastic-like [Salvia splendens]
MQSQPLFHNFRAMSTACSLCQQRESEEMEMNNAAGKNGREQASSSRSGLVLGLAPSSEYTFLVYASPVGNYFKEGTALISLYVEDEFHRAGRGGSGGVKSVTNYAPLCEVMNC